MTAGRPVIPYPLVFFIRPAVIAFALANLHPLMDWGSIDRLVFSRENFTYKGSEAPIYLNFTNWKCSNLKSLIRRVFIAVH